MTADEPTGDEPPNDGSTGDDASSEEQQVSGSLDTEAARDYLLDEHAGLLRAILDAADRVAAGWADDSTTERPVEAFERELQAAGIPSRLPGVLAGAVDAAGGELQATPVSAPPYVVVTSEGVLLRATLPEGRLVVAVEAFALEPDPRRYVRRSTGVESAVAVTVRR